MIDLAFFLGQIAGLTIIVLIIIWIIKKIRNLSVQYKQLKSRRGTGKRK